MSRPLYIFDLDGTLALIDHRSHLVTGARRWREFFAACVDDRPNEPIIAVMQALLTAGAEVWVWSGRSDEVKPQTLAWLERHAPGWTSLNMRRERDNQPDTRLKKSWLDALTTEDRARLVCCFDDRQSVVDMYRAEGITVCQVAPGDF